MVVVFNETNLGVGGAVMAGYARALADGVDVVVKMDGDDQMDASALPQLVGPILRGEADYTKGNRFYDLAQIGNMPRLRIFGNAVLSFMAKISRRYFFETDMLFRLNTLRAVVADVPMDARYGDEISNMRISRIVFDFAAKHARNTFKRIFYNYFLRDLSLASIELVLGLLFIAVGAILGLSFWFESFRTGVTTSAGSVMLAALQVIVGIQLMLGFLAYDIASVPRRTLHPILAKKE